MLIRSYMVVLALALLAAGCGQASDAPPKGGPNVAPRAPDKLPRRAPAPVHVAAVGDIACSPDDDRFNEGRGRDGRCYHAAVAAVIRELKPDAVLALGDIQYDSGAAEDYAASFNQSWKRLKPLIYPTPGNHEYEGGAANGYFEYFGVRAGSPTRSWYAFDLGTWRVISVNTNCRYVSNCHEDSEQFRFVRHELAAAEDQCTLVFGHHPRFSSGYHGDDDELTALWRMLMRDGADLYLAGHDHHYERLAPLDADGNEGDTKGVPSFVVGTGGKESYLALWARDGSKKRITRQFGALDLELTDGQWASSFVNLDGQRQDDASGTCRTA